MRKASALSRFVASGIAVGVLLCGCGQPPAPPVASTVHAPGSGRHVARGVDPANLPAGTIYRNPASGRDEMVIPDVSRTALLIGDSQSEPADGWPRLGLAAIGYKVHFCGLGGTGFVATNGKTGNYIDALQRGDWLLPYGTPPLIVIQGGGNDAGQGATDAQIVANADRLVAALNERYPGVRKVLIGTLGRGANYGGGRRSQVDALLGSVAARHGMPFVGVGDWLTKYNLTKDLADAVHMNASGRRSLGALLENRLRDLGITAPPVDGTGSLAVAEHDLLAPQ
ncbi:SGNH/GDSL hydrolase family protein [Pseudarthrobacter sp. NPDC055928]|uniref:SGNH/GDSL hydrolase family protein n=1 Tax=Pseudarthrobacter sp. NPDC055928 TaxID=3345661 RepID=UPI0035D6ABC6